MEAKLVVVGGKASKQIVALNLPTVVGRSREADLTVAHPLVSRRHCEIFEQDGLIMVRDLGSLNGTLIDGRRIELAPLPPDGQFCIGPLTFSVYYEYHGSGAIPAIQYAAAEAPPAAIPAAAPPAYSLDEDVPAFESVDEEPAGDAMPDFASWADADSGEELPEPQPPEPQPPETVELPEDYDLGVDEPAAEPPRAAKAADAAAGKQPTAPKAPGPSAASKPAAKQPTKAANSDSHLPFDPDGQFEPELPLDMEE